ncbi:amidohydrolase family protein [Bradyrhizobium yuanmingense]|uniref:amidohydrolase family protein n=1 Tax=Bradyrhizobium yuanmingense TaxID=108015 RepID=UPI0023B90214|nr:amidohydrolase family protein [Bradyrhizobium yuanmingense]MDF0581985.1 amidohydrolase family protein [Bradyrhizobium yuanmingense]
MTEVDRQIIEWVEETPFVDTHEHLIEESQRLSGEIDRWFPCDDWSYVFSAYVANDLVVAGMSAADQQGLFGPGVSSDEKYRLIAPYWHRIRHTGYAQAVRHTIRGLYGEDDLTPESLPRIAEKYRNTVKPGFYANILRRANVECCQVNSMQRIFMESEQPALLTQDLSILEFCRCSPHDFVRVEAETGKSAATLDEWLGIIDFYFAAYSSKAVAVKCQIAYSRALDFAPVAKAHAARLFLHQVGKMRHALASEDLKALQDFLFRYCVEKAGQCGLPVKLHTGYLGTCGSMQLARVRDNAADLCRLLQDFPETRFVLMHIGYPYEQEFIALAKHYPNATIDMCWAWIINPGASVRFLKEFLLAVPATKIFTFGGDYVAVEPIYGHACVARRGIANVLSQLVAEGWVARQETPDLIERIMRGNALRFFRMNNDGLMDLPQLSARTG